MLRSKNAESKTPHFRSLNQDIVAWSQEGKCGLKYVIHILERKRDDSLALSESSPYGSPALRKALIARSMSS